MKERSSNLDISTSLENNMKFKESERGDGVERLKDKCTKVTQAVLSGLIRGIKL